jgi:hypothetical protein
MMSGLAADVALADEPQSSDSPVAVIVEQGGSVATAPPGRVDVIVLRWENNPTPAAGGQDDAQRASEQASEHHQDDGGDKRRK